MLRFLIGVGYGRDFRDQFLRSSFDIQFTPSGADRGERQVGKQNTAYAEDSVQATEISR